MWQVSINSNRCSGGTGGACAGASVLAPEAPRQPAATPAGVHCLASAASASSAPSLSDASSSKLESPTAGVLPPGFGAACCTRCSSR